MILFGTFSHFRCLVFGPRKWVYSRMIFENFFASSQRFDRLTGPLTVVVNVVNDVIVLSILAFGPASAYCEPPLIVLSFIFDILR